MLKRFGKEKSHGEHGDESEALLKAQLEEERKTTRQLQTALADVLQKYEEERRYSGLLCTQIKALGATPVPRATPTRDLDRRDRSVGTDDASMEERSTVRERSWSTSSAGSSQSSPREWTSSLDSPGRSEESKSSSVTSSPASRVEALNLRDAKPSSDPSVVSQRIAALSRTRASSSTSPIRGGMPKQLIHTGGGSLTSSSNDSPVSPRSIPSRPALSDSGPRSGSLNSPSSKPVTIARPAPMIRTQSEAVSRRPLAGSLPDSGQLAQVEGRSQTPPRGPSVRIELAIATPLSLSYFQFSFASFLLAPPPTRLLLRRLPSRPLALLSSTSLPQFRRTLW